MDSDEPDFEIAGTITLPAGTMLFQGDRRKHESCLKNVFHMTGQRGVRKVKGVYVAFYTFNEEVGASYAGCTDTTGYTHLFKTTKPIEMNLLDFMQEPELVDTEEVSKWFCGDDTDVKGLYIDYGEEELKNEVAICDPEMSLEYIASRKCGDNIMRDHRC
jgi:hypothetical protein